MQGTVMLGTGEPSPIMKRSPSMRLAKESIAGEKLFSSIDLSSIGRTRRNSIPTLGLARMESRGSVPSVSLGLPGQRRGSSITINSNSSKYRSLRSYLKGFGEQPGTGDISKLDDALAKIKNQLDDMSLETRNVGRRVSTLSQDIMVLSDQLPQTDSNNRKNLTLPKECCRRTSTDYSSHQTTENYNKKQYNTLPLVLPIERAFSQPPPLVQINDVWADGGEMVAAVNNMDCVDELSITEQTIDSQDSQEDFEVKVIHSGKLDNHHLIVLTTSSYDNDGEEEGERAGSCEGDSENDLDVFDNSPITSQS